MGTEIERKFLVVGGQWRQGEGALLRQGYLNRDPQRTVRVRIADQQAFITIKGPVQGLVRAEFEYPIPLADAQHLLSLCDGPLIEKRRYGIEHGGLYWEVDEFFGANRGLVVAEVELTAPEQRIELPAWVGAEVTHDPRYFNSRLATHPFTAW